MGGLSLFLLNTSRKIVNINVYRVFLLKILTNKQVLAVLYVLFRNFARSKRLFGVSSDRAFSNLPLVGIWTIHG